MKKLRIFSYVALFLILVGSVGFDLVSKDLAEKELLTWSSPQNLKDYRGLSIPVFSIGERTLGHDRFYLGFNWTYVRNQGAAWGMLSDLDDKVRVPFFHCVTLFAVLILLFYFRSTPFHHRVARLALVFILSGALGNFADRLRLGYVIDFLDFHWIIPLPFRLHFNIDFLNLAVDTSAWAYDFPKFNWADSMITIGVSLLVIDMLILDPLRRRREGLSSQMQGSFA